MKFTAVPNAIKGKGIWAASGVNEKNVGMTATETITSNARVLGADPLVKLQPAEDGKERSSVESVRKTLCTSRFRISAAREKV